jgi:hypothetical protein
VEVILDFQLTQKQVLIKATQGTFQPGEFKEFFFKYLSHIHVGIYILKLYSVVLAILTKTNDKKITH